MFDDEIMPEQKKTDREWVLEWLNEIGEKDFKSIKEVLDLCKNDKEARIYFVKRAKHEPILSE